MKRAEERVAFSPCVSQQRAQGGKSVESVAWADDSSALPQPEKNKRLSPPAIQSDNKLSTSKM